MIFRNITPIRSFRQYRYMDSTSESVKWYTNNKPINENQKENEKS